MITAAHHAVTASGRDASPPLGFCQFIAVSGHRDAGLLLGDAFDRTPARAQKAWLFVEPCMQGPLMIIPVLGDRSPFLKAPALHTATGAMCDGTRRSHGGRRHGHARRGRAAKAARSFSS